MLSPEGVLLNNEVPRDSSIFFRDWLRDGCAMYSFFAAPDMVFSSTIVFINISSFFVIFILSHLLCSQLRHISIILLQNPYLLNDIIFQIQPYPHKFTLHPQTFHMENSKLLSVFPHIYPQFVDYLWIIFVDNLYMLKQRQKKPSLFCRCFAKVFH